MDTLLRKHFQCGVCGKGFEDDIRVGADESPVQDSDFRTHSQGVPTNPHTVHSCPACGFTDDLHEEELPQEERLEILEYLNSHGCFSRGQQPFSPARQYELQAGIAILRNRSSVEIAQAYLNAAWLAEDEPDIELGKSFRQQAEDYLVKALDNHEVDQKKAPLLTYLVGELNRRLEKFGEALEWFARVRSEDPRLLKLCRQQMFFASVGKSVNTRMPAEQDETRFNSPQS